MKSAIEGLLAEFGFCNFDSFLNSLFLPKVGSLLVILGSLVAIPQTYFGLSNLALVLLLVLINVELITGIWASMVKKRKIVSKKLQRFILKIMIYFLFIMTFHVMSKNALNFTKVIYSYMHSFTILYFIFVHLVSITENYGQITGKNIEFADYIKKLKEKFFDEKIK